MMAKIKNVWPGLLVLCLCTAGAAFAQAGRGLPTATPIPGSVWGAQSYPYNYYGYPTGSPQSPQVQYGRPRTQTPAAGQPYGYAPGTTYYPNQGQYQYPMQSGQYQYPTPQGQYPPTTGQTTVPPGTYPQQQVPYGAAPGQYGPAPSGQPTTGQYQYPGAPGQPQYPVGPGQYPTTRAPFPTPTGQVPYPAPTGQVPTTQPTYPTPTGQVPTTQPTYPAPTGQLPTTQPLPLRMPGQIVPGQEQPLVPFTPTVQVPGMPAGVPLPAGTPTLQVPPYQPIPFAPQAAVPGVPQPLAPGMFPVELSPFEQFVSGQVPTTISFDIKQFGYDLFLQQATTIAPPVQDVPVSPDYVIGPADEVRVTLWGSVEGAWTVVVDRDGNISLPKIGILGVAGLTFNELKDTIQKEMTKYYTDFQMNVSMGPLKTVRVYVVGNARIPGAYNISSLSTLINALVVAGGPSKAGSMREIQLKRGEEVVSRFDLYDLLMKGDKSKDQRVMSEDVIFIPSIGPLVGVAGNVERPAIYELKGRAKVSDVIKMAGGVTAEAYLQRVQVERVFQRKSKVMLDLNLQSVKGKDDIVLEGGDIVKVFSIAPTVTNKIVLQGNVHRPGEYEWKQGVRVKDLIPSFDALLPDAMLDYAIVERKVPPDLHQEYRSFNLGELLSGKAADQNILLEPYDVVTVFNKYEVRPKEKVRINGAVNVPGEFEFRPNMKVSDLLKVAGGLKAYAYTESAEITRTVPAQDGPVDERIEVNLNDAMSGDALSDVSLKENDYLLVKSVPDWNLYRNVTVLGEVKFPGGYALKKGEVLSSLIERAGGYTDKAYLRGAAFHRWSVKEIQQIQINEMINRLEREFLSAMTTQISTATSSQEAEILAAQSKQKAAFISSLRGIEAKGRMVIHLDQPDKMRSTPGDITLEEADFLYVPTNPQTVQVIGAVYSQSAFVHNPEKGVVYYIQQAGGYTETADEDRVYVIKADGSGGRPKGGLLWNPDSNRWASGSSSVIGAGDTIIVPDKLEEFAWARNIKDLTQVLYQIAVGAGVLLRL